jgi:parvulin-like peptidyl-prolyl isomerase
MSDELPKKVFSVPPPPTDEIDSEWGGKGADESGKTATQAAEEGKAPAKDSGPPGADAQLKEELAGQGETAAAPSTPPPPAPASKHEAEDEEEDEEEDDEEEEDEEEDDEDAHPVARASHGHASKNLRPAAADDWLPDWAPWVVLGGLVLIGIIGGLGAFSKPPAEGEAEAKEPATTAAAAAVPTSVEASHFLVQYKGAMRAPEAITRTKEEAKKRAEEGLAKAKKGGDFAKLVGEYSDEPGAAARGGSLGEFSANQMVKPFSDAAFKLKVGEISGLIETDFGFHVIKRTK